MRKLLLPIILKERNKGVYLRIAAAVADFHNLVRVLLSSVTLTIRYKAG